MKIVLRDCLKDISSRLGVPYILLNSGNDANIPGNLKLFYTNKVIPIVDLFGSAFTKFFGVSLEIKADREAIEILRPELKAHVDSTSTLVNGGIITPNEGRARVRYAPIEGLDEVRDPANIVGGSAVRPDVGGRPEGDSNE